MIVKLKKKFTYNCSATKDCTYVIHTATQSAPCQGATSNEDDVIKPIVDGLTAVLKACQKQKVKRLVLTSTVQTILGRRTFKS